ncbi:MAG: hypothetical protein AAGJ83_15195, partial [Planctomycetota bacterium]
GLETSFPIPIQLSQTDLENALAGNLVTRVIYLEDPQTAVPLAKTNSDLRPIDLPGDADAMEVADTFGRPIAILRIGSKTPPRLTELQAPFFFGFPAWAPIYQPEANTQVETNTQPQTSTQTQTDIQAETNTSP